MREDSPLGQERGGTLEKGAQGKYLASPLPFSRSLGFGMSPLAGAAAGPLAGADSCRLTARRRWGQHCRLLYVPAAGVVLGHVHPGCLRES